MIKIEDINLDTWMKILYSNSPDDKETSEFLHEYEEEILDKILDDSEGKSLDEKRREYISIILGKGSSHDLEIIVDAINNIRENNDYSILQFGKQLPGSSYKVYEFGDKIIKLGKYCKILNDPIILQPEFKMHADGDSVCMYVYERLSEIFTVEDKDIAELMYQRVRDNGMLWFDAIGYNVGRTDKRIDENDDGLRIIDVQYMEYVSDVLLRIDPQRNEKYKYMGNDMYYQAIFDYIVEHGYGIQEKEYQEFKEKRKLAKNNKEDVEEVAKKSSVRGLKGVKEFFSRIFRKVTKEKDGKQL